MKIIAFAAIAAVALAFGAPATFAACQLPNGTAAGSCTYSGAGPALTITDGASSTATATPSTFKGVATGTGGHGVAGEATGKNGVGGFFQAVAPSTATTSTTALQAVNSGGNKTSEGDYGSAGVFNITNAKNESPSVSITTNGINSYGLSVTNSGRADGNLSTGLPFDEGGMAGFFALTNANNSDQSAVYAITTGGTGAAGEFVNSNASNTDQTVFVQTNAPSGVALQADLVGTGSDGFALAGFDKTSGGGVAAMGQSINGVGGEFISGSANCSLPFDSATGWSCSSDRNLKEDFHAVDGKEVLRRLVAMPVWTYRLKQAHDKRVRLLGPVAQDFKAAFGLGEVKDDTHINGANEMGVALAAIQGLYAELKGRDATILAQEAKIAVLERRLASEDAALARVQAVVARLAAAPTREARLAE